MIAEKTADAIKGRKLTPFEPPTRIATGGGYNRQQKHYTGAAKMHASSSSIHHANRHLPKPTQYHTSYISRHKQKQLQFPPPIGQQTIAYSYAPYLSRSLVKELAELSSAPSSSNNTMLSDIQASLTRNHDLSEYLAGEDSEEGADADIVTLASSEEPEHDSHKDFLLDRYSLSKMTQNLVKRISPIR